MGKIDDYVDKFFIANNVVNLEVYKFIPDEAHVYMIATDKRLWPIQDEIQVFNILPYVGSMLSTVFATHLGSRYNPGIAPYIRMRDSF